MRSKKRVTAVLALGFLVIAAMGLSAQANAEPTLTLTAAPTVVSTWQGPDSTGYNSTLTVTAVNGDSTPGAGSVTLEIVNAGSGGMSFTPAPAGPSLSSGSVTLSAGSASATYSAGAFPGDDTIKATWVVGDTTVTASATISACLDTEDEAMCPVNIPLPIDDLPCNPSNAVGCLPPEGQDLVAQISDAVVCVETEEDPTTCLP